MRIDIWYENEMGEQTEVVTYSKMSGDPFNIGDVISLSVKDIYPVELSRFSDKNIQQRFIDKNNEKKDLFHQKKVRLTERKLYVDLKFFEEDSLVVEYFCEFVEE